MDSENESRDSDFKARARSNRSILSEDDATPSMGESQRDELSDVQNFASAETVRVRQWRRAALFMIFAAGVGVSYMTFAFLSSEEDDNHIEFEQFANSIDDITKFRVTNMFNGLRGFGEMITAHAQRNREEWPMVTVPNFEVLAEHTRVQTEVEFINFVPLVDPVDRDEYEKYAYDNQWWIKESRNVTLGKDGTLVETSDYVDLEISGSITSRCETGLCPTAIVTDRVYAPVWQVSPPPFVPILVGSDTNNGRLREAEINAMKLTRDIVMGSVFSTGFLTGASISSDAHDAFHSRFVSPTIGNTTSDERPHFLATTPVFRELGSGSSDMVAIAVSVVTFDVYMANLLPKTVEGVDLVIRSTCNQTYTYRISGAVSAFVGTDDFHNPRFDHMEEVVDFNAFLNPELSIATPGHCVYRFSLYPTKEFVDSYKTPLPAFFTAVVATIFLLLFCVFFVYDHMGQRRNKKVEDAAARSNSIVASLFPKKIRAKLFEEAAIKTKKPDPVLASAQSRLHSFITGESRKEETSQVSQDIEESLLLPGKPLADLFTDTTIMFADIVGFTAWSASREPSAVFTLLETLYRGFDLSAKRRRVFKVETIGDCYVAVAGIPDPLKDHAIAMCRFAKDCQTQMRSIVMMLESTLGEDTTHLTLRIGLHSGSCTAGVLRGEKSRFQLFGDTMNTASRMESTGETNRIQISQETADLLIMAGKPYWVTPRKEKVHAKGKGELQTYWVDMPNKSGSRKSSRKRDSSNDSKELIPSESREMLKALEEEKGAEKEVERSRELHTEALSPSRTMKTEEPGESSESSAAYDGTVVHPIDMLALGLGGKERGAPDKKELV